MGALWRDIRFGLRTLRKNPGFTAFAVLTIALGIGVNTAMFSLVANVLLRPLPVANPSELVAITSAPTSTSAARPGISWLMYLEYRDNSAGAFTTLAGYSENAPMALSRSGGEAVTADAAAVTGNYFDVLGVHAFLGRLITPQDDDRVNDSNVVVLSHRTWRELYGGRADALGKTLQVGNASYSVIGIAPPDFTGISLDSTPDVWIPMSSVIHGNTVVAMMAKSMDSPWFKAVGRLKPGVTLAQAREQVVAAAIQLGAGKSVNLGAKWEKPRPTLELLQDSRGGTSRAGSLLLFGAIVLLLLLVVCDIASMLLARFERRRREVAIRLALGASRVQVARPIVVEGMLLSILGSAAGLVVAYWSMKFLLVLQPAQMQWHKSLLTSFLEGRALLFTILVTVFVGLFFSIAPAIRAARSNVLSAMSTDTATSATGRPRAAFRGGLIAFQTAVSVLLLAVTLLFFKTYWNESHLHLTYDPHGGFMYGIRGGKAFGDIKAQRAFWSSLLEAVASEPGVQHAALATNPLLVGKIGMPADYYFQWCRISPGYFDAMGRTLIRGRDFNVKDQEGALPVAIVNQTMADRFFTGKDPVGQRMQHLLNDLHTLETVEIVGVVSDTLVREGSTQDDAILYMPLYQQHIETAMGAMPLTLLVRSKGDAGTVRSAVQAAVDRTGAGTRAIGPTSLEEALDSRYSSLRLNVELFGGLAVLAMLLTASGLFGLISYITTARTHELGLRLALGASRPSIVRLILRDGLAVTLVGVAIGLGCEFGLMRFLSSFMQGMKPVDAATSGVVALILTCVAIAACYVPAHRASRLDPMAALRHE
jgi:predicted permease